MKNAVLPYDFRLIFMFSNWYSGATLFAILLNNHPDIVCNGETFPFKPSDMDIYMCSCGNPLIGCDFFRSAASHMLNSNGSGWNPEMFLVLPYFTNLSIVNRWFNSFMHIQRLRDLTICLLPNFRKKIVRFVDTHLDFMKKACLNNKADAYIDGTKSIRRAEYFVQYTEMPIKAVHLIRDARAFCFSFLKNRHLGKEKLGNAIKAWIEYIDMVDTFSSRYPHVDIRTIRYEDLCRNSSDLLKEVCAFIELPFSSHMSSELTMPYHVLGNVMRKTFDGKIKESTEWMTVFTSQEILRINQTAERYLSRFGYL